MATEQQVLIKPNFDQVTDQVSEGAYTVRISGYKTGQWAASGDKPATTYINWELKTFGEDQAKNNGRIIFHRTPIEGKGAFRLQAFWRAATGMDCPADGFDPSLIMGVEIAVTVAPQLNKPEYMEVKSVSAIKH